MPHAESSEPQAASGEKLFVNDSLLNPGQYTSLRPMTLDIPLKEARRRYREDDHLFVKGLLPGDDVLKAREEYFKLLSPSGVFNQAQPR